MLDFTNTIIPDLVQVRLLPQQVLSNADIYVTLRKHQLLQRRIRTKQKTSQMVHLSTRVSLEMKNPPLLNGAESEIRWDKMMTRNHPLFCLPQTRHPYLVMASVILMLEAALTACPGSRYVPPHLRNRSDSDEMDFERMIKLTRQLKGLLNR